MVRAPPYSLVEEFLLKKKLMVMKLTFFLLYAFTILMPVKKINTDQVSSIKVEKMVKNTERTTHLVFQSRCKKRSSEVAPGAEVNKYSLPVITIIE